MSRPPIRPFSVVSKSQFQKQKELEEERNRKEAEETARVYAEFASSFDDGADDAKTGAAFVRGGVVKDGKPVPSLKKQELYRPPPSIGGFKPIAAPPAAAVAVPPPAPVPRPVVAPSPAPAAPQPTIASPLAAFPTFAPIIRPAFSATIKSAATTIKPVATTIKSANAFGDDTEEEDERQKTLQALEASKKKRNLDMYLEEIKRDNAAAGAVTADLAPQSGGSYDNGDPNTTNIHVGNLHPMVTEDMLCREFGKFGPIASVKIMWPKEEERSRPHNSGFVSFMKRRDAKDALHELEGKEINGYQMRLDWGKAVAIPALPIYDPTRNSVALDVAVAPVQQEAPLRLPFSARPNLRLRAQRKAAPPPGVAVPALGQYANDLLEIPVDIPTDANLLRRIHRTVEFVIKYGEHFELGLIDQQKDNAEFAFLTNFTLPEHVYYRWRLFSIMQGDILDRWRLEPFTMYATGPVWIPPPLPEGKRGEHTEIDLGDENAIAGDDRGNGADNRSTCLGARDLEIFREMLRNLTIQRYPIGEAMMFIMEHAEFSDELADVVVASLMDAESPLPTKVARLFLVSDVLHNSSVTVPNAWKLRLSLEKRLAPVFVHLNLVYRSIPARLRADQFKTYIVSVLNVWDRWAIYTPNVLLEWRTLFMAPSSKESDDFASKVAKHTAATALAAPRPVEIKSFGLYNNGTAPPPVRRKLDDYLADRHQGITQWMSLAGLPDVDQPNMESSVPLSEREQEQEVDEEEEEEDIDGVPIAPELMALYFSRSNGIMDDSGEEVSMK